MAEKRRRDLRGVSDEKYAGWQHHLDQIEALKVEALRGTSAVNPKQWSQRRAVNRAAELAYHSVYTALREPNVSTSQFHWIGADAVTRAKRQIDEARIFRG